MKSTFRIVHALWNHLFKCMHRKRNGRNTSKYIWMIMGCYNITQMPSALSACANEWTHVNKQSKGLILLMCSQEHLASWQWPAPGASESSQRGVFQLLPSQHTSSSCPTMSLPCPLPLASVCHHVDSWGASVLTKAALSRCGSKAKVSDVLGQRVLVQCRGEEQPLPKPFLPLDPEHHISKRHSGMVVCSWLLATHHEAHTLLSTSLCQD